VIPSAELELTPRQSLARVRRNLADKRVELEFIASKSALLDFTESFQISAALDCFDRRLALRASPGRAG
jgi:hypothetical protein